MKFRIVEEASPHRTFTATPTYEGYIFEPLGWQDFIDFFHKKKPIKISVRNAHIVGSENGSVFHEGRGSFEMAVRRSEFLEYCVLVENGWLPVAFAKADVLLPDANISGSFRNDIEANGRAPLSLRHQALAFGARKLNPILAAIEGNQRQAPKQNAVISRQAELCQKIGAGLGDKKIDASMLQTQAAYEVVRAQEREGVAMRQFLAAALEIMKNGRASLICYQELESLRARTGLERTSIPFLLCVDYIFSRQNCKGSLSPAREVLKPNQKFSDPTKLAQHMHNVCSDIWLLNWAALFLAGNVNQRVFVGTYDLGLVGFWAKIRPHLLNSAGGVVTWKFALNSGFAETMPEDLRKAF